MAAISAVIVASRAATPRTAVGVLLMVLACGSSLCVSAPAYAADRATDVAATRAYLSASEDYARRAYSMTAASVVAIEARATGIAQECPSALTDAPRDAAFEETHRRQQK